MILTNRNDFGQFVAPLLKCGVGAEVGTQYGVFARLIADRWPGQIMCVDLWPDEAIFAAARKRLSDPRFMLCRADSARFARYIADGSLDWVYIDADHHYANVKADLEAWFPKVRPGGLVAGHDYVHFEDMGVIEAVDEFVRERGYQIALTTTDEKWHGVLFPTWYFVK